MPKILKAETCSQTVFPDKLILIGRKLVENAKNEKLKCDILDDFQTLVLSQRQLEIPPSLLYLQASTLDR